MGGGGHPRGRPGGGFGGRSQEIGSCQPDASGPRIREAVPGGMRLPVALWLPLALGVAAVAAGQSPLQRRVVRDVLEYFHGRSNVHFLFKEREVDGVIERVSNGIRHRQPGCGRRDGHGNGEGASRGNGEGDGVSGREQAVEGVIEGGSRDWRLGFGVQDGHENREGVRGGVLEGAGGERGHGARENRIRDWDSGFRIRADHGNGEGVGVSQEQRGG